METAVQKQKPTMLTINEAARQVDGLTKFRIRQLCIDGDLPHIKAGNKYLINKDTLLKYIS